MTCSTCMHWKALEKHVSTCIDDNNQPMFGECRRNPPRIVESFTVGRVLATPAGHDFASPNELFQVISEATAFPITDLRMCCGKFKSVETE